jgi:molybdenum cofactor synthesis domain-containing protein
MSQREQSPVTIELIAIGNELLRGIVQDTNTYWLCRQLTGRGGQIERISLVPDALEAIVEVIQRALSADRVLIITTGGLGPTHDDLTLEAIAQATERPLQLHPLAEQMVGELYQKLAAAGYLKDGTLSESRRKMALLPRGAEPLKNGAGAAPGVLLKQGGSLIVALPGVPREMRNIFENALRPHLEPLFGDLFYLERNLVTSINDESQIALLLKEVQLRWPQVYFKSRARSFSAGMRIQITLTMSDSETAVRATLSQASADLRKTLAAAGIRLESLKGPDGGSERP